MNDDVESRVSEEQEKHDGLMFRIVAIDRNVSHILTKIDELQTWQRNIEVRLTLLEKTWGDFKSLLNPIVLAFILGIAGLIWAVLTHKITVSP